MPNTKDRKKFFKQLEAAGITVEIARSGHLKLRRPNGSYLATMSESPSDANALSAARRLMRRLGIELEDK